MQTLGGNARKFVSSLTVRASGKVSFGSATCGTTGASGGSLSLSDARCHQSRFACGGCGGFGEASPQSHCSHLPSVANQRRLLSIVEPFT